MGLLSGLLNAAAAIAAESAKNGKRNLDRIERSHGSRMTDDQRGKMARMRSAADVVEGWASSRKKR